MFTKSIRWRMQLWLAFLLACILSGFGVTAYQLHRTNELRQIDNELDRRVSALSGDMRRLPFLGPTRGRPPTSAEKKSNLNRLDFDLPPGGSPFDFGPDGPFSGRAGPDARPQRGGPGDSHEPRGGRSFGGGRKGKSEADDPGLHRPEPDRAPSFQKWPGPDPKPRRGGPELYPNFLDARELRLSTATLNLFDETETNGYYYTIWSRTGNLLKCSTNAPPDLFLPEREDFDVGTCTQTRLDCREAFRFNGIGECALVGRCIKPDLNALRRFAWLLVAVGAAVLTLGFAGGWVLTSRALRPVEDISAAAGRIYAGNLSERINVAETENELGHLAGVLNSTFARLEAAFAQQKQFTADASHELRTPLAVLISETQTTLARERTAAEYRETVEACLDTAQQMKRLTQSLLELARYDAAASNSSAHWLASATLKSNATSPPWKSWVTPTVWRRSSSTS